MDIFHIEIDLYFSKSVCSLISRECQILSEIDNLRRIEVNN